MCWNEFFNKKTKKQKNKQKKNKKKTNAQCVAHSVHTNTVGFIIKKAEVGSKIQNSEGFF